ncbi:hypothetical protein [Patulibacter minatonensis]|uniref:hypothetical protein n=1 Tax=Patulibacter minatonensis TaxID=298163 RepID=UPI00047A3C26|nr:hypothetical protein [Patulibacter minatonensis]
MSRLPNPSFDVNVDPVLGAIVGAVIVLGGGAAAYGATRDTEPDPAPPATAQAADPVVERALAIVQRVDGTTAADGTTPEQQAARARAAKAASAKGRSVDPFPAVKDPEAASTAAAGGGPTTATTTASAATGSSSPSAVAQATGAAAKSDAANAAVQKATGGSTATTTTSAKPATGGGSAKDSKAVARRLAASKPAKVTLRIATQKRRTTVNKRSLGLLVPTTTTSVARVVEVSSSNRVVTLRLRSGAYLTGKQSKGTMCVQRLRTGSKDCRLIRVRTGRTAVIRAPRTAKGKNGAVTALRVLSVWRGGFKLAE